jgi:hypothetical protein
LCVISAEEGETQNTSAAPRRAPIVAIVVTRRDHAPSRPGLTVRAIMRRGLWCDFVVLGSTSFIAAPFA